MEFKARPILKMNRVDSEKYLNNSLDKKISNKKKDLNASITFDSSRKKWLDLRRKTLDVLLS